jgi:hypothetical protein
MYDLDTLQGALDYGYERQETGQLKTVQSLFRWV